MYQLKKIFLLIGNIIVLNKFTCYQAFTFSDVIITPSLADIGMMVRVFTNGLGGLGSIPRWIIAKTQKMVLDASLLNTQHYKVGIKDKEEQSREWSSILPYTLV